MVYTDKVITWHDIHDIHYQKKVYTDKVITWHDIHYQKKVYTDKVITWHDIHYQKKVYTDKVITWHDIHYLKKLYTDKVITWHDIHYQKKLYRDKVITWHDIHYLLYSDCQQFHQYEQNEQTHLTSNHCTQKMSTTNGIGHPSPGFRQAQNCGWVKPVNESPTPLKITLQQQYRYYKTIKNLHRFVFTQKDHTLSQK